MEEFQYSVVASALHDPVAVERIIAPVRAHLDASGGQPGDASDLPQLIVVATGGTEAAILDHVARRRVQVPWEPVTLVAHPLHNSLPAALEALARLRLEGIPGRIVQVAEVADRETLTEAVGDVGAVHRMHRTRLGLVGQPSEWLVASVPDADELRRRWGIELVPVDIADAIAAHPDVDPATTQAVAVRYGGPQPDEATSRASAFHPALTGLVERDRLGAIAVRCFDVIAELDTSGCVALAELNDAGLVAGCEGDVASTVAMLLVRALVDQPAWIANPTRIDPQAGTILLAHCTVAPSMVESIELHTHFESGTGIGLRGRFAPGWVTLVRLGGAGLERRWVAEAEIVATGDSPDLCRTQVTVRVDDAHVAQLLDDPLGNHLVMFHGRHRARVERWLDMVVGAAG